MTLNRLLSILIIPAIVSLATGCSAYNKLLKSRDTEQMYVKALEYLESGKYQRTISLFDEIRHYYMNTPREDSIAFYTGLAYYKQGDFESSALYFDNFRQTYGRSPFLEEAEYMYAKGFYYLSPEPNRDQAATNQALVAINEYLDRYPNSVKREALLENIEELIGKLHDKAFLNAKVYYTTEKYKAAIVSLRTALDQYPDTRHREEMLYLTAKSAYLLASNSVTNLQRDRYLDMLDAYYNFISEYPESKWGRELEKMHERAQQYLATHEAGEQGDDDEYTTGEYTTREYGS